MLNVFLAIAVDNLADAVNMTKIDEEEKRKKKDAKLMKKLAWKTKMDSLDSDGYGREFFNRLLLSSVPLSEATLFDEIKCF